MWKFIPAILLGFTALLIFFRAPTNLLWKFSILITEFSWIPILVALLTVIIQYWLFPKNYVLLGCNLLLLLVFFTPTFSTYLVSSKISDELAREFGTKTIIQSQQQPFSFWNSLSLSSEEHDFEVLEYQQVDGLPYTLHFYEAEPKVSTPLVIVIHGGSWAAGDATEIPAIYSYLANRNIHVASINYRLAPKYKYPAPVEDVEMAYDYLMDLAEKRGIRYSKVILMGRSAGGQIALQAGYGPLNSKIAGVISFYAPADMLWGAKQITNDWVLDVDKVLVDYIGCSVKENEQAYINASAYPLVDEKTPPTLLIHGKIDAMVSHQHSTRLLKTLKQHKVKSMLIELGFATHGCDYNFNGPSGQVSRYAIERFIANS